MTKDITNEFPSPPKSKFNCPVAPYIPWHHGLIYKECPVADGERDMSSCSGCPLKGESKVEVKDKQKSHKNNRNKDRKETPSTEKRTKDSIPKIGKTYTSE